MNNPSKIHAFFEKLSQTVASTENERPSFEMLHSGKPARPTATGLQELIAAQKAANNAPRPTNKHWEVNDFGVGLPPLAHT